MPLFHYSIVLYIMELMNALPSLSPHLKVGCEAGMYSGRGGGGGSRLGLSGLFVTAGPVGCCSVLLVVGLGSWLAVVVRDVST